MPRGSFVAAYVRFRTGKWFFWALAAFCAVWVVWNSSAILPHFDNPGFPLLTLILSIEASLQLAFVMMDQETKAEAQRRAEEAEKRQEEADRRRDKYMLDVLEAVRDMVAEQKEARSCGSGSSASSSSPASL